jgi:uncharacterized protein DUF2784
VFPLLLANLLVLLHLAYILFVLFGAALVAWRRWIIWLHLPAIAWGTFVSAMGWVCPLTPWENHFRQLAGQEGYQGGFIEHYILPVLYPAGLTLDLQRAEAVLVVVVNSGLYLWVWRRGLRTGD